MRISVTVERKPGQELSDVEVSWDLTGLLHQEQLRRIVNDFMNNVATLFSNNSVHFSLTDATPKGVKP